MRTTHVEPLIVALNMHFRTIIHHYNHSEKNIYKLASQRRVRNRGGGGIKPFSDLNPPPGQMERKMAAIVNVMDALWG